MKENEETLYDRQIRLWGFEAQKRMMNAKVLLCGLHGYSAEVHTEHACTRISILCILGCEELIAGWYWIDAAGR